MGHRPPHRRLWFKRHCAFVLWSGEQVVKGSNNEWADVMVQLRRITSLDALPPRHALTGYVKAAAKLIDGGGARARAPKAKAARVRVPSDLREALALDAGAKAGFDGLPPSHKREYVECITDARTAATRERRLATTLEWLAAGKHRNWKYDRR